MRWSACEHLAQRIVWEFRIGKLMSSLVRKLWFSPAGWDLLQIIVKCEEWKRSREEFESREYKISKTRQGLERNGAEKDGTMWRENRKEHLFSRYCRICYVLPAPRPLLIPCCVNLRIILFWKKAIIHCLSPSPQQKGNSRARTIYSGTDDIASNIHIVVVVAVALVCALFLVVIAAGMRELWGLLLLPFSAMCTVEDQSFGSTRASLIINGFGKAKHAALIKGLLNIGMKRYTYNMTSELVAIISRAW